MSWEQLQSITKEAREEQAAEVARPPVACPSDGTALEMGGNGVLFCRWCGWRPDQ